MHLTKSSASCSAARSYACSATKPTPRAATGRSSRMRLPRGLMDLSSDTSRFWRERILITVKTYPTPQPPHHEAVCTAGINAAGKWRRLWPIPFRYLEKGRQFRRYEWIDVALRKQSGDLRPESHVVDPDTIVRDGFVDARRHWGHAAPWWTAGACREHAGEAPHIVQGFTRIVRNRRKIWDNTEQTAHAAAGGAPSSPPSSGASSTSASPTTGSPPASAAPVPRRVRITLPPGAARPWVRVRLRHGVRSEVECRGAR